MAAGEAQGYSPAARGFHWVTAALVLTMIPVGVAMANADFGAAQDTLYHIHRSIGALLLPIALARLYYRWRNPAPPLPDDVPAVQRLAAQTVHWALYALLIVQPLIGWIATSAYRAPVLFFWMFELPPIWKVDQPFSEAMFQVHRALGIIMALLIGAHIAGALYHYFVRKDRILMRMVSG
ncbi:MAG: cytochrome b [Alphaproteobacteria bacterium]|nr:cytochrome b [Alphaproteobacteria bacterium]